jgi:spermidine/putrescine-binding protein
VAVAAVAPSGESKVLNVLNWADCITPDTIANLENETGFRVRYDHFDANETLFARLLAGRTGYDVVVPGAPFASKLIEGGGGCRWTAPSCRTGRTSIRRCSSGWPRPTPAIAIW